MSLYKRIKDLSEIENNSIKSGQYLALEDDQTDIPTFKVSLGDMFKKIGVIKPPLEDSSSNAYWVRKGGKWVEIVPRYAELKWNGIFYAKMETFSDNSNQITTDKKFYCLTEEVSLIDNYKSGLTLFCRFPEPILLTPNQKSRIFISINGLAMKEVKTGNLSIEEGRYTTLLLCYNGEAFETANNIQVLNGRGVYIPSVSKEGVLSWTLREEIGEDIPQINIKGEKGITPQKGKDYWTTEDQQSIVNQVISSLVNGDSLTYGNKVVY